VKIVALLTLLLSVLIAVPAGAANLLPHANIDGYTSAAGGEAGVRALYDGQLHVPWTNEFGVSAPYQFIFSWDGPVIIGGIRVAVPGGGDTSVCARDIRVEILPEGHLEFWEARHIRVRPHEGYQSFLLPALPTRRVRLTVLQNHGHPVRTYISEIELLNPLDAGHRESMPGTVNYTAGAVWLHNGLTDTAGMPRSRESLSDVFALVTGDGGEATVILADNPSPFSEGKGLVMQVGGFGAFLADRYYDGKPRYRFLLAGGDFTVYTLHPEAEAIFYTREGMFRLSGEAAAVIKTAPAWGTMVEVREGKLSVLDRRLGGFPALDLEGGELVMLPRKNMGIPEPFTVSENDLLAWFAPLAAATGLGSEVKWLRQARNLAGTDWRHTVLPMSIRQALYDGADPDTLPALVGRVINTVAEYSPGAGTAVSLARYFEQARQLADLLLYGQAPWQRLTAEEEGSSLAAICQEADLRCGFAGTGISLQPYGENRRPLKLADENEAELLPVVELSRGAVRVNSGEVVGITADGEYVLWHSQGAENE